MSEAALGKALEDAFSPEFRNRLDRIVQFAHLPIDVVLQIVDKEIKAFALQLEAKSVFLEITPEARHWLAETGYDPVFGARNIARLFQEHVKSFFVDAVLFGDLSSGGRARVSLDAGKIKVEIL